MKLRTSLRLALNILVYSRLRSWLSIIGIVIGVIAVITILSLGEGLQRNVETRLSDLGVDTIIISPGFDKASGVTGIFEERSKDNDIITPKNLTNRDIQSLKLIPNIDYIGQIVLRGGRLEYLSETSSVSVKGVNTVVWKNIVTTKLESGRYLSESDKYSVVVGNKIAKNIFKQDIQIGRQIMIEAKPFKVVGILEESSASGSDDNTVFIPIDVARTVFDDIGKKEINSIEVKVKDIDLLDDTINDITQKLMMTRAVNERTRDFIVSSVKAKQEKISETLRVLTLFLAAIAAISLIVGSVGIANTMFTTVLEKTKEIGIMKAVGAKNKNILLIFLFNSGMIGLGGGIIGSILGIFTSKMIPFLFSGMVQNGNIITVISFKIIVFVLIFSILIGIISGIVPAYKASRMDPVDAIRY